MESTVYLLNRVGVAETPATIKIRLPDVLAILAASTLWFKTTIARATVVGSSSSSGLVQLTLQVCSTSKEEIRTREFKAIDKHQAPFVAATSTLSPVEASRVFRILCCRSVWSSPDISVTSTLTTIVTRSQCPKEWWRVYIRTHNNMVHEQR